MTPAILACEKMLEISTNTSVLPNELNTPLKRFPEAKSSKRSEL